MNKFKTTYTDISDHSLAVGNTVAFTDKDEPKQGQITAMSAKCGILFLVIDVDGALTRRHPDEVHFVE